MQIGTNFPISPEYSPEIRAKIKEGFNPFDLLALAEVEYVEFSLKQLPLERVGLQADIAALAERGIHAHFHPYYKCAGFGTSAEKAHLRDDTQAVIEIADGLAQQTGQPVVLNFHAGDAKKSLFSPADLMEQSDAFHHWLMQVVRRLKANVIITTEHQLPPAPEANICRIGDRFEELLLLKEEIPDPQFGLCWDMGHSVISHLRYHAPLHPAPEFLAQVRHVHIHDVRFAELEDHCLIGTGNSPLSEFVTNLLAAGYQGNFTMEYPVKEIFGADYVNFLCQSKANLLHASH